MIDYKILSSGAEDIQHLGRLLVLASRTKPIDVSPWLYPATEEFYRNNLMGQTLNVAAFDGDVMVGYAALRHLVDWPEYLGEATLLPQQCGLMLINLVDPDYRRLGIGRRLAEIRVNCARNLGWRRLYVTVHPSNEASVRVLDRLGFVTLDEREIFSEKLLRKIMCKNLSQ